MTNMSISVRELEAIFESNGPIDASNVLENTSCIKCMFSLSYMEV